RCRPWVGPPYSVYPVSPITPWMMLARLKRDGAHLIIALPLDRPRRDHGPHTTCHQGASRREGTTRIRRLHAGPRESAQHRAVLARPAHARDGATAGSPAHVSS